MKNKIAPVLALIIFLTVSYGCAIKSLSQEAWCKILNISQKEPYSRLRYSNLLWSKDSEKIYFIANDYTGHYYRVVQYSPGFDLTPPFLSFLFGSGEMEQVPYADTKIVHTLYKVIIDDSQNKIESLASWESKTKVSLGISELDYYKIAWLNDREICDWMGNAINVNTAELKHSLWDSSGTAIESDPNSEYILVRKIVNKKPKLVTKLWQPSRLSVHGYRADWVDRRVGGDVAVYDKDKTEVIRFKRKGALLPSGCDFVFSFVNNEIYPSSDAQKLALNVKCEKEERCIAVINIDGSDFKLFYFND